MLPTTHIRPLSALVLTVLTAALLPSTLACEPTFSKSVHVAIANGYGGSWTLHGDAAGTSVFVVDPIQSRAEEKSKSDGTFEVVRMKGGQEGDGVYTIQLANKPGMAISNVNGHTQVEKANESDSHQQYHIECQSCTKTLSQACKITLKSTGECLTGSEPGDFVAPSACNPRSGGQFWKLTASPK